MFEVHPFGGLFDDVVYVVFDVKVVVYLET